ncbi:MAG: UDP-N-acetylmuramate--L-alanine ligase [Termitinemataceae bacterium]|nr:MAG: UDP-N-acetylmuramate--L-alanine ligase [Termitinemataceae bacterium]
MMTSITYKEIFCKGSKVYMIGIKGSGMCAFAEILKKNGVIVSGSDTADVFYTDAILKELDIPYHEGFSASNVPSDADIIVHSAAYSSKTNCELARANELHYYVLKYTDALGAYSLLFDSTGISGVHGKTTTTAMAGVVARAMELKAQVLVGSAVGNFSASNDVCKPQADGITDHGHCALTLGGDYFIAETCEYRKHFMAFYPEQIVLTSVESDHQDFYPTYNSIRDAFVEYVNKLPRKGTLIYCADDKGASEVASIAKKKRKDIIFVPYGFTALGKYKIINYKCENERSTFNIEGFSITFSLQVSGRHNVLNACAAFALCSILAEKSGIKKDQLFAKQQDAIVELGKFIGSKRRQEILGTVDLSGSICGEKKDTPSGNGSGILFMDDYAHHPTAIKTTLNGIRSFYPNRRIVVSFMPHTYTRTQSLLDDFADSFKDADVLFLHKIYPSAREVYTGGIDGRALFEKTKSKFSGTIFYEENPIDAAAFLKTFLKDGDLFITMGAGDNWTLGRKLFSEI